MNRRSLFKKLYAMAGALCVAPFIAKSSPKYVFCSGPRNGGKTSGAEAAVGWDAGKAIIFYSTVDRLADSVCFSTNQKILFVSPEPCSGFNESWQSLCQHEKILATRSSVRMNGTTKQIYFTLANGTKVMLFRAYPNCDFECQTFGRKDTMICALEKDMDILDHRIQNMRTKSRPDRYFTYPDGVRADLKTGHFYYPINGKLVRSEWLPA